jgi:hypothetical protein
LNGGRFGGAVWLAFQVKRKLLPEEEILGLQDGPKACSETCELEGVLGQLEKHQNDVHQGVCDQHGTEDATHRMLVGKPLTLKTFLGEEYLRYGIFVEDSVRKPPAEERLTAALRELSPLVR